jgi:DNA-binding IclR family transcriptional regulator
MTKTPTLRLLPTAEQNVLRALAINSGRVLDANQLAKSARTDRAAATSAAKRLVAKGWISTPAPFRYRIDPAGAAQAAELSDLLRAEDAAAHEAFMRTFGPLLEELRDLVG